MKNELYRIEKGTLVGNQEEIAVKFAIIYENDGIISAEIYVNEGTDLKKYDGIFFQKQQEYFTANFESYDGDKIEIKGLDFKRISPYKHFIEMICYGSLLRIERKEDKLEKDDDPQLHYLVLEGLEMEYCTATVEEKSGRGKPIGAPTVKWDHTSCGWSTNMSLHHIDFYKNHENVVVEFDNSVNSKMTLSKFHALKKDFVSFISFINGAPVTIRKECFGSYRRVGVPDSEKTITYSFKRVQNIRHNDYLLLNTYVNRPINILGKFLIQNFDAFAEWNKKIDLSSIIHYLNGAVQTRTLEEQYFILIIAFERLTALYAELSGPKEIFYPDKSKFQPIKEELFAVMDKHKNEFGDYFARAKSVIGGMNQVKRLSTKDKMYGILTDVKIEITQDITDLIDEVRNSAVHKGDIGLDGVKHVYLLNELLHEIILKLIEYRGPRKSTVLYGQTIVTIDTKVHGAPVLTLEAPPKHVATP